MEQERLYGFDPLHDVLHVAMQFELQALGRLIGWVQ
jgi:hypothetical protein